MGWIDREPGWFEEENRPPAPAPAAVPALPAEKIAVVIWIPIRCPSCSSLHCPTTGTAKVPRMRYHRCSDCGTAFKSFEGRQAESQK